MPAPRPIHALSGVDPIREAAAHWHDRLRDEPVSAEDRKVFEQWRSAAVSHRQAYAAVERAWAQAQAHAEDPQILALRQEAALRLTRRAAAPRFTLPRAFATAAAMVIVGVLGIASWRFFDAEAPVQSLAVAPVRLLQEMRGIKYYRTSVGERLNVVLDDGSLVTLNTHSELKVEFTAAERKVVLTRGQVLFEVAKNAARPFVVEAQDRRFIAVGTAFDVRLDNHRVQLTMLEGKVKVEQNTAPSEARAASDSGQALPSNPAEVFLTAGQQLVAMPTLAVDEVRATNADRVSSWRNGQVMFENTRLADAVTELNRYTRTPIEIADPALSDLRISGAFMTGRSDTFVEAVITYFPIQAQRNPEAILLTHRQ